MKQFVRVVSAALILMYTPFLFSARLLVGDTGAAPGMTFSFPINKVVMTQWGLRFYTGARTAGVAQEFALANVHRMGTQFEPLAQEFATVNGELSTTNPLFNTGIAHLALLEVNHQEGMGKEKPVVVTMQEPARVYVLDRAGNTRVQPHVVVSSDLRDAAGATTNGILGLATAKGSCILSAVTNNAGDPFGAVGSGVALSLFMHKVTGEGDEKVSQRVVEQVGDATALNTGSTFLALGSALSTIGTIVDMHWDTILERLYVALSVTGGAAGSDGARSIAVGRLATVDNGMGGTQLGIVFDPIAPDAVFTGNTHIVGGRGADIQVTAQKVRTLYTSTRLSYLIVLGGNGDQAATARTVFALPLVNNGVASPTHGTVADKSSTPVDTFMPLDGSSVDMFKSRGFVEAATTDAQAPAVTDAAAQVGCGALAVGDITDLFVANDSVYAVVGDAVEGQKPGVFCSTALFDSVGKIKGWTAWQRVGGSTATIFTARADVQGGKLVMVSGTDAASLNTVKRTEWGRGANDGLLNLSDLLHTLLPPEQAGIQGLCSYAPTMPGLVNSSLMVATGYKKVVLVELGQGTDPFCPNVGDFTTDKLQFTNGAITENLPGGSQPRVIELFGGDLDTLGAIQTAEVASAGGTTRLFVGGTGGLAVLVRADGTGWSAAGGIGPNFTGLVDDMVFKRIGSYRFVRKLIHDGNFLYVLTDTTLERIDLVASDFAAGTIVSVLLADVTTIPGIPQEGTLLDMIISGKLAVIATSRGLVRLANGNNIAATTIAVPTDLAWRIIDVPEGVGPVQQLIPFSKTGRCQDITRDGGGYFWALGAYRGYDRSQINRFAVEDLEEGDISDTTIVRIPDLFIKDAYSYIINFGDLREQVGSICSQGVSGNGKRLTTTALVRLFLPGLFSGARMTSKNHMPIDPLLVQTFSTIVTIQRNPASGSSIVAGDNGLLVNE